MQVRVDHKTFQSDLLMSWSIVGVALLMLVAYIVICLNLDNELIKSLPEVMRVKIRTLLYVIAIVTFPATNLIRHIQLKLNQTMPFSQEDFRKVAKNRYLLTIIISMSLIETVGAFGFVMYMLGDGFNNLTIFTLMSGLGMYLYRPKEAEYAQIIEALANPKHE